MRKWISASIQIAVMSVVYVLMANARTHIDNPFFTGAEISMHLLVPIIAGILFGAYQGAFTGLFGNAITLLTPEGGGHIVVLMLSTTVGGYLAGLLNKKPFAASFTVFSIYIINIITVGLFRLPSLQSVMALLFEGVIGVIIIMIFNLVIEPLKDGTINKT